jgi:hypothetical protein
MRFRLQLVGLCRREQFDAKMISALSRILSSLIAAGVAWLR